MRKAEIIFTGLAILGAILSFSTVPGGSFLIIISCTVLSSLYLYLGFALFNTIRLRNIFKKQSYSGLSALRIIGGIAVGFVLSIVVIGLMFRIMVWEGSTIMLIVSIVPVSILTVIALIKFFHKKDTFYIGILKRVVPYTALAALFLLSPASLPTQIRHRDNPEYVNALKALDENPQDEEAQRKIDEIEAGFRKMRGEE